jgi:25S rRNA (uracil2634-N3)-methyltransferase
MDELESQVKMLSINNKEVKWMKHYSSCHKILLVGEGDFSFAACLGKAFGSAVNMVATSLYSKGNFFYSQYDLLLVGYILIDLVITNK